MCQLSIIIVHYNVPVYLKNCISSIYQSNTDFTFEILVIDNSSLDNPIPVAIKELFPDVNWFNSAENLGFSKACNIGATYAKGRFLLFLNPDVVLEDTTTLQRVFDFYNSHSNAGALGVRITDELGNFRQESKRNIPNPFNSFQKLFGGLFCSSCQAKYYKNNVSEYDCAPVEVLTGAFLWIEKEKFFAVGGFDERYFMYGEDIDLCKSLLEAGFVNYYYGATSIVHFKGKSSPKNHTYYDRFFGAMKIYVKKHYTTILIRTILLLGIDLRWIIARAIATKKYFLS